MLDVLNGSVGFINTLGGVSGFLAFARIALRRTARVQFVWHFIQQQAYNASASETMFSQDTRKTLPRQARCGQASPTFALTRLMPNTMGRTPDESWRSRYSWWLPYRSKQLDFVSNPRGLGFCLQRHRSRKGRFVNQTSVSGLSRTMDRGAAEPASEKRDNQD